MSRLIFTGENGVYDKRHLHVSFPNPEDENHKISFPIYYETEIIHELNSPKYLNKLLIKLDSNSTLLHIEMIRELLKKFDMWKSGPKNKYAIPEVEYTYGDGNKGSLLNVFVGKSKESNTFEIIFDALKEIQ